MPFDQSPYFKSVNPNTGLTDIFQNAGGTPQYINAEAGKTLFNQGLNADLLQTKPYPTSNPTINPAPSGTFKIDIPQVISAEDLRKNFEGGLTSADITKYLNELRTREARTAELMVPTAREKALQEQLASAQTSFEAGINKIRGQVSPMPLLVGQEAALTRQAQTEQAGIQRNLGLEQGTRQINLEASKALGESTKNEFNILLQADQALKQREQLIQNAIDKQSDNARNILSSVLTNFGGLEWKDLDAGTQMQLSKLAQNAGFPLGLLQNSLQTLKQRQIQDKKTADIQDYEYAKQGGFAGSFIDYQKLKANLKNAGTGAGTYVPGQNPTVDHWAKLIIAGQAKITDVPNPRGSTLRSQVVDAITNSGQTLLDDKDREKLGVLQNAKNVVATLKELSAGVAPRNAFTRLFGGPLNYLEAAFQTNDQKAAYVAARKGFVSNIARTLGEKGTLAEGDVARAIANIPTLADKKAVADRKFAILQGILDKAGEAIIGASTLPLNQLPSGGMGTPGGTVKIGGRDVPVNSIIVNNQGQRARVNADGTLTPL